MPIEVGQDISISPAREYDLRLNADGGDQHEETFEVVLGEDLVRLRCHDYAEIFDQPGLYEQLFHEELHCESPTVVSELLGKTVREADLDPTDLRVLDVGAGNGMVAEALSGIGAETIVGVDILPEAAAAAWRDRPDLYLAYHVMDLTDMDDHAWGDLEDIHFNAMTTIAALGFSDMPPLAFANAFNLVSDGGWIAFNLKDEFLSEDDSGFAKLIHHMIDDGNLEIAAREHYRHRLSVAGDPIHYVAVVGRKRGAVSLDLAIELG